jgi:hypothetical protein
MPEASPWIAFETHNGTLEVASRCQPSVEDVIIRVKSELHPLRSFKLVLQLRTFIISMKGAIARCFPELRMERSKS